MDNINNILRSAGLKLVITVMAIIVSYYATLQVFTAGLMSWPLLIGILKTNVLEVCKTMFFFEFKKSKKGKLLTGLLWVGFMTFCLLHTMIYEIKIINEQTSKSEITRKNNDFKEIKSLESQRDQLLKDKNEIIKNNEIIINELKNDKAEYAKSFDNTILDYEKNMQRTIDSTGKMYQTRKAQRSKEKTQKIKNLNNEKNGKIEEYNNKITSENLKTKVNIKDIDKSILDINKQLKMYKNMNYNLPVEGMANLINLLIDSKNAKKTMVTLIITLILSIFIELAGCKCWELYQEQIKNTDLKTGNKTSIIEFQNNPFEKINKPKMDDKEKIILELKKELEDFKTKKPIIEKEIIDNTKSIKINGVNDNHIKEYLKYIYNNKIGKDFDRAPGHSKIVANTSLKDKQIRSIRDKLDGIIFDVVGTTSKFKIDSYEEAKRILELK